MTSARGAAPLDAVFAMTFVMLLALGIIEVAMALYARNVVASSAHEGARAAVELGRDPSEASAIARRTVQGAARGLVDDLRVHVSVAELADRMLVRVRVAGVVDAFGPVPVPMPVSASATTSRDAVAR